MLQVMEMLERGETPSNVRTDINDKPPNPGVEPPTSRQQPRSKPWERPRSPAPDGQPPCCLACSLSRPTCILERLSWLHNQCLIERI